MKREPDFPNLLRILRREATPKPALFELFMNWPVYRFFLAVRPVLRIL